MIICMKVFFFDFTLWLFPINDNARFLREIDKETRPDTRLPKSCAGGQGPYLRLLNQLGRSSEVKEIK